MQVESKKLPVIPEARNLLSHHIVKTGEFPKTTFTVVFDYPDCTRTFDGREWTVTAKEVC